VTRRSTGPWRLSAISSATTELWAAIALAAEHESPLWADSLRPPAERDTTPVFSALAEERFALGLETIYEGYLLHYGEPRLFSPEDVDTALLLGDYLYAEGLVRVAALEEVLAVSDLAELISLCAQLRAERDQLGQIRHGQHLLERRDADESLGIEVVPEQKRRVDVFGREEPRLSVMEEISLVDRLEPEREALLGQR